MSIDAVVTPEIILAVAVLAIFAMIVYYCIRTTYGQCTSDTTVNQNDDIYTVETLPPAYSGLSIRLPPSYSQACRIIGYHRSQEHISEEHTNVGFENDVSEIVLNRSSSDLSNTNVINFPSSSDNTNSQDNIQL